MRRTRLSLAAALALATSVGVVAAPTMASAAPKPKPDVPVQLVTMNDFHGRIANTVGGDSLLFVNDGGIGPDAKAGSADDGSILVGGSANIASTVKRLQSQFTAASGEKSGSWFVGAGDLISATPFESAVFKDEPTIEVLNAMGLDVSSVGNHEFDRGTDELRRVSAATDGTYTDDVVACPETLNGEPFVVGTDGCFGNGEGHDFHGAEFPYLAANVLDKATGEPMLPPYQVFDIPGGKKVALIGVVTETTPDIVDAAGIADVRVIDEAEAVNKWVPVLQRRGVEAIGVLVHEGGQQNGAPAVNHDTCANLTGPIVDINNRVANAVDLIVSAHTHAAYNCKLPVPQGQDRLVTSAGFYGRLVSDIRLTLDGTTGDVIRTGAAYGATNVTVTRDNPDAEVQSIVDYWVARSAVPGSRVVGEATAFIGQWASTQRRFEQPIGNLVAQAQLEALQSDLYGNPVISLMNPGGVRNDIDAGPITYAEVFNVQPFGNNAGAMTLTGAQIDDVLEQQYQLDPDGAGPLTNGPRNTQLVFGSNEGFTWSYNLNQPYGERVSDASVKLNGVTLDPAANYRVAVNSFLAPGQDGFTVFRDGKNYVTGPVDVDALESYIASKGTISPPPANHSTQITG